MHHEYALDPECVNDWSAFKYVVDQCGFEHGRLISRFPGRWERSANTVCKMQGAKRTAVIEKLRNMKNKLVSANRDYDKGLSWLANATKQHETRPFHAIIASANPQNREKILIAQDIDAATLFWNVPREKIVPRKAYDLACCARKLLNVSQEILLIDPNFNPELPRFVETLSCLVKFAFENNHQPKRLELHVEYKESKKEVPPPLDIWQKRCHLNLSRHLPEDASLMIFRWRRNDDGVKPHARYVLTELGGVRYDYGLDEWKGDGQTTDVSLMAHSVYERRWCDYQEKTAAYTLIDHFSVPVDEKEPT